nr:acyl carrier protein [Hymenolepis microstoma]
MVGVKKHSESANSSVSLNASQQAGAFFPRQFQSSYDSSTRLALNFTPSLFRMTASSSSWSLSEMASDSSTSSRRLSAWEVKRRQSGSELSRSQVNEVVRLVLASFSPKIPHPHKLKDNSQLSTDFGFDSLDRVNLLKTLEKSFNFRIFADDFDNLEKQLATPCDIANFICRKLAISC